MRERIDLIFLSYVNLSAALRERIKTLPVFKRCRITVVIRSFGTLAKTILKSIIAIITAITITIFKRESETNTDITTTVTTTTTAAAAITSTTTTTTTTIMTCCYG